MVLILLVLVYSVCVCASVHLLRLFDFTPSDALHLLRLTRVLLRLMHLLRLTSDASWFWFTPSDPRFHLLRLTSDASDKNGCYGSAGSGLLRLTRVLLRLMP